MTVIDKTEFCEKFNNALLLNDLSCFSEYAEIFAELTERMLTVNEYMNLTAICDVDGVILKHYVDSLYVSKYIGEGSSVIDIGCGGGFPSMVLAIARPDLKITALDSTAKRINYINETAKMLKLTNLTAIAGRAEELSHQAKYREKYDIAVARAVARLNILCEFCLPYVKSGGSFIAMKANANEEVEEAVNSAFKLGGKIENTEKYSIKDSTCIEPRTIVKIRRIKQTEPKYPRAFSQIKKKPL